MGFVQQVEAAAPPKYVQYYVRYEHLKELILDLAGTETNEIASKRSRIDSVDLMDEQQPVAMFQKALQGELEKVNHFACLKHEDIFLSLRKTADDCTKMSKASEEVQKMAARIEALSTEIVHLDTYVRLNYLGFQKITKRFDQCLSVDSSALYVAELQAEPFCNVRFDDILILLGLCWSRWRAAQSEEQSKDATWKPPESFIRNTSKYWVRPDQVVLLKTRIVQHLPYLLFGASIVEQERLLEPFALLDLDYDQNGMDAVGAYSGTLEESQLLSSVYFDSPDATCYQERIRREEAARLVRFRWYGENDFGPNKEVFVERKIHHEGWGGLSSAKERCIVPQGQIFDFMKGKMDIDAYFAGLAAEGKFSEKARKAMKGICHEVNNMIQEKDLQPIIRTSYYRCAFQLATSNEVRISLDTQMTLLNEYKPGAHPVEPWCHVSSDLLRKDEIYRFPFAILEIKLQNVSEAPAWLTQTLADIGAVQVHKFSKFQHAMAFLHPERVPILPHWHQDFVDWHEARRLEAEKSKRRLMGTKSRVLSIMSQMSCEELTIPKIQADVHAGGMGHRLKDMENLDPKGIFASERTLLHYAEKGLYVGALSAGLLYQDDKSTKVVGAALATCTMVFYVWTLLEYYSRLKRIKQRAAVSKSSRMRLDWAHGPIIIVAIIFVVVCIAIGTVFTRLKELEDTELDHHHRLDAQPAHEKAHPHYESLPSHHETPEKLHDRHADLPSHETPEKSHGRHADVPVHDETPEKSHDRHAAPDSHQDSSEKSHDRHEDPDSKHKPPRKEAELSTIVAYNLPALNQSAPEELVRI
eukprot:TRINITY_DN2737_c0_g1_i1.p1 TRINITY_DN2737_c0_g1~~TRINITY_DN2737_c0_g1_i1.p1  ORF type:complete len:811 (-),score=180.44 TRINITY_DN2737_c0_g1_i1:383-2815(-)